jgi:hypothetical protein
MDSTLKFILATAAMFFGMIVFLEIGRRVGIWRAAQGPESADKGISAVDGAVFALFGLLLAFTFSGANARFEHRRVLITQEANAIGTAYMRIDLLPAAAQPEIRSLFRQYVQARIARYKQYADEELSRVEHIRGVKLQGEIWKLAVAGVKVSESPPMAAQIFSALNEMVDITTIRLVASQTHPPRIVFIMLFGLAFVVSMLAGYGMSASKTRQWLHVLAFSTAITATVYVIIDIEYPRSGLIRIDPVDQLLVDVLDSIK